MRSNENYHQQHHVGVGASRRRLPFDSNSTRMSSSTALKRAVPNTFHYPHEIFLNKSSSSSMTENDDDSKVKILDEPIPNNRLIQSDKRRNNHTNKRDIGGPMIQELLQSNMDLKKEIRDIRRQIKHNIGANKQQHNTDHAITTTNNSNKTKIFENDDYDCSFAAPEYDSSTTISKLQHYKSEATVYKQQLDACQDTIGQLRKTINSMEKRIEQLRTVEHRQVVIPSNQHENLSTTNNTDHRFIHELFHLCIKYTPRSSKLKTNIPTHHDMKTFIRQTFTDLIKTPSSSSSLKISANKTNDSNHFICKCSDRIHTEHRPTYQYSLSIIEQCQTLFDVTCFTQLSTALNELYYRYGELINFKRSIISTLGITENSKLISCPKLIKILQQTLDDAKSNELVTFKKLSKINDMNEAISKIRSYDDFVPYYHQFIEQMANLLEVSKGDEIMPAIKTLKLLAHGDNYSLNNNQQESNLLTRTSSLNTQKHSLEKPSKSLKIHSSKLNQSEKQTIDSQQPQTTTDDGES